MKINYDVIMPGDIVLTTSLSFISCSIRIKEAGLKNAFNTGIANHVGIVVPINTKGARMIAIAEMLGDGLHISSFSTYLNQGYFGDRIVDIRRFAPFQDPTIQEEVMSTIFDWWEKGKKYDYAGVLEYVLPFLKDKENKFYCSEMVEWLALNKAKQDLLDNKRPKNDNITPYDIQKSKLLPSVQGWKN